MELRTVYLLRVIEMSSLFIALIRVVCFFLGFPTPLPLSPALLSVSPTVNHRRFDLLTLFAQSD